jgi:hypothetical protein
MALGPQQNFNSYGRKFQGYVNASGGFTVSYKLPQSPARPSFSKGPFFVISGAARAGGDWAGLVYRYTKVFTPDSSGKWFDPNTILKSMPWLDPNTMRWLWTDPNYFQKTSGPLTPQGEKDPDSPQNHLTMLAIKDKVTKTMTSVMNDGKTLIDEMLETGKATFTGTGAVYEGKTVLGDISGDIYNDGIPSVARSKSGEIMAVWAKAFAASLLGTKIYSATYTAEGWSSPVEVTPEIAFNDSPSLTFDSRGNPMAVWSSASNNGLDYERSSVEQILQAIDNQDLMYSQRIEGKWTAPKVLAVLPGLDEQVNIAAGPNGEVMAVWVNQSGKGSLLYSSLWNGVQWTEPALIANAAMVELPLVIYNARKPSVIWTQDEDGQIDTFDDWKLYSSSWDGTSWHSQPLSLSGESTNESSTNKNLTSENKDDQTKFRGLKEIIDRPAIRNQMPGRRRVNY